MIYLRKLTLPLVTVVVAIISASVSAETWDLSADWSDTTNPNGVWSYNGNPNGNPDTLILSHVDDWDPGVCCFADPQPAWADGHVPFWAKVVSPVLAGQDFPIGKVLMHGDGSVAWTSPINGIVTIIGGIWFIDHLNNRSMDWSLSLNDIVLTEGTLDYENPRSSVAPFPFEEGTGGENVLTQVVNVGDVIRLRLVASAFSIPHFMGVNLAIDSGFGISNKPSSATTLGEPFSFQFNAIGGAQPFSWSIIEGSLPTGLIMGADGSITGAALSLGSYPFVVQVIDSTQNTSQLSLAMDVVLALPAPSVRIDKASTALVPGRIVQNFIVVENIGDTTALDIEVFELIHPATYFELIDTTPDALVINDVSLLWNIDRLEPSSIRLFQYSVGLSPDIPLGTNVPGPAAVGSQSEILAASMDFVENINSASCLVDTIECQTLLAICALPGCHPFSNLSTCASCSSTWAMCTDGCDQCQFFPDPFKVVCGSTIAPIDPNEKIVVAGEFIRPDQTLVYVIHFENIGDIEALDVFVTDTLDSNLDESSLQLLTPGASYDSMSRTIQWELLGINLQPGETDSVLFSVNPLADLPSGTTITNHGEIQFEIFETIVTPDVTNVIDRTLPTCTMDTLPLYSADTEVELSWVGIDAVGEIKNYSIYHSVDGSGFMPLIVESTETSVSFSGKLGEQHSFFCISEDTVGNIENQVLSPETMIIFSVDYDGDGVSDIGDNCVVAPNPDQRDTDADGIGNACDADLNGDCAVNFIDLGIMKSVFFGSDPNADLDGDGAVNFVDLGIMKAVFFLLPGPSGLPNICDGA